MLDEEIISLNRMKLFARSSDLSVVIAKDMNIVVNLVEKQQKEIEELKNGQIDFWISDKEIEERIRNKFVSNDKIKAKIEEIKEEIKTCYIYKKTGRCTNNCKEACFYYDVIDILQRLLEGK